MTSQLNVDTIVDKAGSGGTNVKVKGSNSTYVDGTATQNLVEGLTKQRVYYDMYANTVRSSFNTSSITDGTAGRISINLTSPYSSLDDYQALGFGNAYNGDSWNASNTTPCKVNWHTTNTTSLYDFTSHGGGYTDSKYSYAISHGDLA